MANYAVVRASEVSQEGRWDAGFHLLLADHKKRRDELRLSVSEEAAAELLKTIALADKRPLLALSRYREPSLDTRTINAVEREYPHLSLAILEGNLGAAVERVRGDARNAQAQLDAIEEFASKLKSADTTLKIVETGGFRAGWIYPLAVSGRYDDELGQGYDHVVIPEGVDGAGNMFIIDAWIVNGSGEAHPGYDCDPVPIRREDVDLTRGRQADFDMPSRKAGTGWGMGR